MSAVLERAALPPALAADLRTDHAGETGAVCIYRGVLALSRDPALRDFARRHLATEQRHLAVINGWLPAGQRSRLLPLWRLSGWLTGALPTLFGPRAVYATIAAVETFVDVHYQQQIDRLAGDAAWGRLRAELEACRQDEAHHRDEAAAAHADRAPGLLLRLWCTVVGWGSAQAVSVCRHV
ncbi:MULTISPECIES: demethoxyubiquinone hydroxylase family protein [unclassified Roseateles]|uniref:demethoxyubiquinone hydroxylase family protein n=1 Tax=unclassified Roseateles TaxID=2626991 RepID=UPI0006F6FB7C|nr:MULTISPECIES: demethoxyubiquinone hydroxylase family protein [unclassified Roseateles]KQW52355.1 ubiquinone biosynthesis protein COQ7 [Pelomonas sp. Root405]KRA78588.1 ubiquinone biosynthesis protein COQ7 [Pelomonas sp. Root662]